MNVIRMCVGMSSVLRELLIWNTLQQQQKNTTDQIMTKPHSQVKTFPEILSRFPKIQGFYSRGNLNSFSGLVPRLLGRRRKKGPGMRLPIQVAAICTQSASRIPYGFLPLLKNLNTIFRRLVYVTSSPNIPQSRLVCRWWESCIGWRGSPGGPHAGKSCWTGSRPLCTALVTPAYTWRKEMALKL